MQRQELETKKIQILLIFTRIKKIKFLSVKTKINLLLDIN